tara:strand:- start:118 stop:363 length:246 start_codon:yes stop_codon:yes gene_type:complete
MKRYCKKNKNIDTTQIYKIERWILNDCSCNKCKNITIENIISDIKIHKEPNIQLSELMLTSKMIIKIQTEIAKKHILDMLH